MKILNAHERAALLMDEAIKLGLDGQPTESMIAKAIRDAEWNALWFPVDVAKQHDQCLFEMRKLWLRASKYEGWYEESEP